LLLAVLIAVSILRGHIVIILPVGDSVSVIILALRDRDTAVAIIADSVTVFIHELIACAAILGACGVHLYGADPDTKEQKYNARQY